MVGRERSSRGQWLVGVYGLNVLADPFSFYNRMTLIMLRAQTALIYSELNISLQFVVCKRAIKKKL